MPPSTRRKYAEGRRSIGNGDRCERLSPVCCFPGRNPPRRCWMTPQVCASWDTFSVGCSPEGMSMIGKRVIEVVAERTSGKPGGDDPRERQACGDERVAVVAFGSGS